MKPSLVLAVAVVLVLTTVAAPAVADGPRDRWSQIPSAMRDAGLARANANGMFAKFQMDSGGNVTGRFVAFHYDNTTGAMENFTVKRGDGSARFFDAVTPATYTPTEDAYLVGSQFRAPSQDFIERVHNNPVALSGWHALANGTTITFTLAPGASIATTDAHAIRINLGTGHGHIITNGAQPIETSSDTITVHLDMGETALFMAHPGDGPGSKLLHFMLALFVGHRLGAFANIADGGGEAILDDLGVDANVTVTKIGHGGLTIQADSNSTGPKILIFFVDPDTLDGSHADKIRAKLNGQAVDAGASESDVDAGNGTRVFVLRGERVAAIIIKIPHFSTNTIELQDTSTSPTSGTDGNSGTPANSRSPGLETGVALLVTALAAALVRRPTA